MVERLGKYQLLRTLGRGAMGEVYLAHHPVIGREVALKTILQGTHHGEEAEARFRREATAAGQLSHPNLVTIFDFDRDGDTLFLVMEYVKGDDLEDLIRDRRLTQAQFLEVLAQICDGLEHAHRAGIIHRDIKPSNVRVVQEGRRLQAKVMDFGIARIDDSNMTNTGIVMGTVSYMAPEYIKTGHPTVQADLWAVGVMLYECLAGRKPFQGDNTTTVLFKIVSENPTPVSPGEIHGISPVIREVLEQALCKAPEGRFATAESFARALRACMDPTWVGPAPQDSPTPGTPAATAGTTLGLPVPSPVPAPADRTLGMPAPLTAPPPIRGTRPRRWPLVWGAAALLLLAGASLFVLRARRSVPAEPSPGTLRVDTPAAAPESQTSAESAVAPAPLATPPPVPLATSTRPPAPQTPSAAQGEAARQVHAGATSRDPQAPVPLVVPPSGVSPTAAPEMTDQELGRLLNSTQRDPRAASILLQRVVQSGPRARSARLQGLYLASLYEARSLAEFERAYDRALALGVGPNAMLQESAAFKKVLLETRQALRSGQEGALPKALAARITQDVASNR